MRLSDFILLSEEEKKWTVYHQGVPLAKREQADYRIFLFQLQDYYVETFCNKENKSIEEYRVFNDTECLGTYLSAIPLDDLLN
ncbi:MAG TPA: hypothetical protein VGB71_03125 [Flavisolibacter sp.]|jgi:hypothetical protein